MAVNLTINGAVYSYPEPGDTEWGANATDWAIAVTNGMLQKSGGLFQLLADVDFGSSFGLVSIYYKSRTANIASVGSLRLARADSIAWRNEANSADLLLSVNSSNVLTFNGTPIQNSLSVTDTSTIDLTFVADTLSADIVAGSITNSLINASAAIALTKLAAMTASRAVVSDGSGFLVPATTTATEIGYVNGVTSSIQTQLNAKVAGSDYSAKGVLLVGTGAGTYSALTVGSNGQVLSADSSEATGVKWISGGGGGSSQITVTAGENLAAGDAIYISVGNANGDTGRTQGLAYKLDATNDERIEFQGFATTAITAAANGTVSVAGEITVLTGVDIGKPIFASVTVPGGFQLSAPTADQEWVIQLGNGVTTTSATVNASGSATAIKNVVGEGSSNFNTGITISSNYTVQSSDNGTVIWIETLAGAITVSLPDASTLPTNFAVTLKDIDGNASVNEITVDLADNTNEMDSVVDGTQAITENFQAVTMVKKSSTEYGVLKYMPPSNFIVATGGTITDDGDYKVHSFTTSGDFEITSGEGDVEYVVVAGGGGGGGVNGSGGNAGGGGGAGGYLTDISLGMTVGIFPIVIGAAGAGANGLTGTDGTNSNFDTFDTALGGGGGGRGVGGGGGSTENGEPGGSGGGGPGTGTGGSGTVGQGNNGGSGGAVASGAGGGGAGAVGQDAPSGSVAGNGGDGLASSITGSSVYYAGGGGGGANVAAGTGGLGGGANGGATNTIGNNATANTGGGGGGGGGNGTSKAGGNGASGIVIVRYRFK